MTPNTDQSGRISGPPRQRAYWLAAGAYAALAIYGSLVPFQYQPLAWAEAADRFRAIPSLPLDSGGRADWVANILLFVPLAYLLMGALTLDTRSHAWRLTAAALTVLTGCAVSMALEFTQLWFPPRTVSQNDVVAESLGAALGVGLWMAVGHAFEDWRRSARVRQQRPVERWLVMYLAGFALYAVLPLDLTVSVGELWSKFKEGKVTLVPFGDLRASWLDVYGILRDIVVFVPIGLLIAIWRVPAGSPVRPVAVTACAGGLLAAVTELAQLLVLSRYTSTTDIVLGTIGAAIGGFWAVTWQGRQHLESLAAASGTSAGRFFQWMGAAAAWAMVVAAIACAPFEISGTPDTWRARYEQFWAVPFANLYYGSEYNGVSEFLRKTLLFGVFGALVARAVLTLSLPPGLRGLFNAAVVMLAAAVAVAIELAQVFLPPHVPDITDVLLAAIGATIGVTIVVRIAGRATTSSARVRRERP